MVPPVTVKLTKPLEPPLQVTGDVATVKLSAVGCVTVAVAVVLQPLASVTVAV